jgi:hypothetical protein
MLKVTQLIGFAARTAAAGGANAVVAFEATTESLADGTSFTFTAHDIGPEAADRLVVVVAGSEDATTAHAPTGVTIGGNAATQVVVNDGTNRESVGIFSLVVASGTTADIVVSYGITTDRCRIAVYTITGYSSSTAHDTDRAAGTSTGISLTLDVPANGAAIAAVQLATGNNAVAWTNATEDFENNTEGTSARLGGATYNATTAVTGHNITASFTSDLHSAVVASWG